MDMQQTAQDLLAKSPAPEAKDFFDEYSVAADVRWEKKDF